MRPLPAKTPFWMRVLLPLLLAALFSSLQLDDNAFNRDEPDSMYSAGIYASGPGTLAEVWRFIEDTHPTQTQGWSKLLFLWGRIAGWSEPAIRSLSLFAGMLALAWLYRVGRDMFSPQVGLLAALLMSASVFFLAYMAIARAFALVVLFTTMIVWSYWRLAPGRRPAGAGAALTLFAGCSGLLYSHYFASLFIPALGLYHLLFVTRGRRWWLISLIIALAVLVSMAQAPGFVNGLHVTEGKERLHELAMDTSEIPGQFLYVLSNYLVTMPPSAGALFVIVLLIALALTSMRRLRDGQRGDVRWMPAFVVATTFLFMVAANEIVRTMKSNRIRYLISLLPLVALLAGKALQWFLRNYPRASKWFLALWLFLGPSLVLTEREFDIYRYPSTFHHAWRVLQQRAVAGDLIVFEKTLRNGEVLYLNPLYIPRSDRSRDTVLWDHNTPLEEAAPLHSPYFNIWLVYRSDDSDVSLEPDKAPGRMFCERINNVSGFTLDRYAKTSAGCENVPARLEFDSDIQLTGPELSLTDGLLRLEAGLLSADDTLLAHYSLALHVIDPLTGERVAQDDVGVGPGSFVPLRSDIDVSALPPGDYEVHLALYDWQTGERLPARDPVSGLVSDMHVLHHLRID